MHKPGMFPDKWRMNLNKRCCHQHAWDNGGGYIHLRTATVFQKSNLSSKSTQQHAQNPTVLLKCTPYNLQFVRACQRSIRVSPTLWRSSSVCVQCV
eukprot:4884372-Amphidinium_carterae.2